MKSMTVNGYPLRSYYPGSKIVNWYPWKQRRARKTHWGRAGWPCEWWEITQTCVLCRLCSLFSCLYCVFFILNRLCHYQLLTIGQIPWMATVWNGAHV